MNTYMIVYVRGENIYDNFFVDAKNKEIALEHYLEHIRISGEIANGCKVLNIIKINEE